MSWFGIFILKIKNTLRYKHNLILLIALPALAACGAWALLTFYIEGGANIPVGILDYDRSEFSKIAVSRFSQKSTVGVLEIDTGDYVYSFEDEINESGSDDISNIYNEDNKVSESDEGDKDDEGDVIDKDDKGDVVDKDDEVDDIDNVDENNNIPPQIASDDAFVSANRLLQIGALESVIIIYPGFSEKIYAGKPEGIFTVACLPSGIARGIVAELFAAQVSRLYFNCDSANRVVRDAIATARSAKLPPLTDEEKNEVFERAYAFCDSYWEPEPLMTVDYEKYITTLRGAAPEADSAPVRHPISMLPGSKDGWQDLRDMLNDLISRAILAIFFTYAAFCLINATGAMLAERSDGVLTRMRAHGFNSAAWIAISAAAPFVLYGIPCAALLAFLSNNTAGIIFSFAALLCVSALGASAAYIIKKPSHYRVFTLICVFLSTGASLYLL